MGFEVDTALGRIEGVEDRGLLAFRGIPYAKPPVAERRFCAPETPESWSGVRDASAFGFSAPQNKVQLDALFGMGVGDQSEDCLYLNVLTPAADGGRRPVMVWIHGGAFTIGSGSQPMYDPVPLALRGDVVIVTINYRLGALGFLHLLDVCGEDLGTSANCGILDQAAALRWVGENIERFGGDPQQVTIFGESAGGMSVGTLMGTPAAQGLFQRAIAQSGAAHRVNDRGSASEVASLLLDTLEIEPRDAARLRDVPVKRLLEVQAKLIASYERHDAGRAFCPAVDGRSLPESAIGAIRSGLSRDVSLLAGTTRDEWKLFGLMDPKSRELDDAGLQERVERCLPGDEPARSARGLIEAYRKARDGRAGTEPPDLFYAIETDRVFRMPAIRMLEAQSAHRPQTFSYLVCWEAALLNGALGACHGIDVPFVFGSIGRKGAEKFAGGGPEAERLSARMMDAWIAFARSGDPNVDDLPHWDRYEPGRRATLIFDRECTLEDAPFDAERAAWDGLF
jgi:para-nitrobenzyl esterase